MYITIPYIIPCIILAISVMGLKLVYQWIGDKLFPSTCDRIFPINKLILQLDDCVNDENKIKLLTKYTKYQKKNLSLSPAAWTVLALTLVSSLLVPQLVTLTIICWSWFATNFIVSGVIHIRLLLDEHTRGLWYRYRNKTIYDEYTFSHYVYETWTDIKFPSLTRVLKYLDGSPDWSCSQDNQYENGTVRLLFTTKYCNGSVNLKDGEYAVEVYYSPVGSNEYTFTNTWIIRQWQDISAKQALTDVVETLNNLYAEYDKVKLNIFKTRKINRIKQLYKEAMKAEDNSIVLLQ